MQNILYLLQKKKVVKMKNANKKYVITKKELEWIKLKAELILMDIHQPQIEKRLIISRLERLIDVIDIILEN